MSRTYFCSSIGKKQLMGIAGLGWCGFVLSHMIGNLLFFVGPEAYNSYSHSITANKAFYYTIETGLLVTLLLHVIMGIMVSLENRRARPVGYHVKPGMGTKGYADLASKTMAYTGLLIFVFIVLHLIKFRFGTEYPFDLRGTEVRDLHRLMVEVFANGGYVAWYLFSLFVLGLHLSHALWSSLQTLALVPNGKEKALLCVSRIFGWTVAVGFALTSFYIFSRC